MGQFSSTKLRKEIMSKSSLRDYITFSPIFIMIFAARNCMLLSKSSFSLEDVSQTPQQCEIALFPLMLGTTYLLYKPYLNQ
jgi:hypothetical protein